MLKQKALKNLAKLFRLEASEDGTAFGRSFKVGGLDCWAGVSDLFDDDGWVEVGIKARLGSWPRAAELVVPLPVGDLGGLD